MSATFIVPTNGNWAIEADLRGFTKDKTWKVTVEQYSPSLKKTREQENYLWGAVYPAFISGGGEAMRGWEKKDLHEFLLGEHFGTETLQLNGRQHSVPLRRSGKLNIEEYSGFIEFIQRYASNLGIVIPDPE
jgi:hypothetical protein